MAVRHKLRTRPMRVLAKSLCFRRLVEKKPGDSNLYPLLFESELDDRLYGPRCRCPGCFDLMSWEDVDVPSLPAAALPSRASS